MSGRIDVRIDRLTVDAGLGRDAKAHAGAIGAALTSATPHLQAAGGRDAVAKAISAAIADRASGR